MKKKILFILTACLLSATLQIKAQGYNFAVPSYYVPMTPEEMDMEVRSNWLMFNKYYNAAYEYFEKKDYSNFLYFSGLALKYPWYTVDLYYDRGIAFEYFNDYKNAKREYKRAWRKGSASAQYDYERCKLLLKQQKKSK